MPVTGYTTEGWGELFLAEAGASAALGGLLFVAVSINLERIVALRSLPGAALGSIVIWIRALRAPIPDQPRFVPVLSVVVTQAATVPMVIAGVSLLLRAGGGLYWLVPGMAFSLVVAVVNAWVLLVEVVR
jgi:hypothetical protein